MSLAGLKLWHDDFSKQVEMRSVSHDLLLEHAAEGPLEPATACHLEPVCHRGVGEVGDQRRTDDNLATQQRHLATKDDNWRQNPGLPMGMDGQVFPGQCLPACPSDPSKDAPGETVMAICDQPTTRPTHSSGQFGSSPRNRKASETTTHGDKWRQNEKSDYTFAAVAILGGDIPDVLLTRPQVAVVTWWPLEKLAAATRIDGREQQGAMASNPSRFCRRP